MNANQGNAPNFKAVETLVEEVAKQYGYNVLPARQFNKEENEEVAPMLQSTDGKTILPDVYCMSRDQHYYAEAKSKEKAVYYTKGDQLQHGIDKVNWEAYKEIQHKTGDEVWIFIFEGKTGQLLRQSVGVLSVDHTHESGGGRGEEMVYWPRDQFEQVPVPKSAVPNDLNVQGTIDQPNERFVLFPGRNELTWKPAQKGIGDY